MTAPRCLIAEDEPLLAESLRADLAALWPELQVVATVGDGASAATQALALRPEVCFLDIRMPGQSGLEAAAAMAEDWPDGTPFPMLVFVTAYDAHALQAFDAGAVDYLVKPVQRPRLQACLGRLRERLADRLNDRLTHRLRDGEGPALALQQTVEQLRSLLSMVVDPAAPTGSRLTVVQAQVGTVVHMVPVADVLFFEAADKYVRVVTAVREHLIRTSLRELLPRLDPAQFWQVHRGTVVQAAVIATARREDSGKVTLTLRGHAEKIVASRLYAHLFKGM